MLADLPVLIHGINSGLTTTRPLLGGMLFDLYRSAQCLIATKAAA
jgi:hypothetical protein